jgi:DNA-binding PadR family transcriptional regulator
MPETLGTFEQAVLVSILRLGEDAYGRAILRQVETRLQRSVVAGAVYATLDRLQSKGFLTSRLGPGTPDRGGRARRFFSVQPAGVRALDHARRTAQNIWSGIRLPLKGRP